MNLHAVRDSILSSWREDDDDCDFDVGADDVLLQESSASASKDSLPPLSEEDTSDPKGEARPLLAQSVVSEFSEQPPIQEPETQLDAALMEAPVSHLISSVPPRCIQQRVLTYSASNLLR